MAKKIVLGGKFIRKFIATVLSLFIVAFATVCFAETYEITYEAQNFTEGLKNDQALPNSNPKLVRQVQASWTAFEAKDNPNNEFIPHWEKYSVADRQTMELNSKGCVCHKDLNNQNLNALRYVYESKVKRGESE